MKTGVRLFACLITLSSIVYGTFLWVPASISYRITERYSFTVGEAESLISLGVLVPKTGSYQRVDNLIIDWPGVQTTIDESCVSVIKLSGKYPANERLEALISYDVKASYGLILWQSEVDECHLQPQSDIESNHPEIIEQAERLANGASKPGIYRIFSFTSDHITQVVDPAECVGGASALEALRTARGECGEFSRLMVALNRATGIPSRVVSGVILPDFDFILGTRETEDDHPGEAHAWVEFYTGCGWSLADPSLASNGWKALYFARSDGRHLLYGGTDLEGKVYQELRLWALENGSIIGKRFAGLKYVASAEHKDVVLTPSVRVQKVWDSRWLNTFVVLVVLTSLFSGISRRYLKKQPQD